MEAENEFIIEWLKYLPSPLVLLRVKSQYILGNTFPMSLVSRGALTIHLLESFTHFPPLISIKSWRNVSCSITWKKLHTQQTQKVFAKVCNKLTTKKPGLTGLNCFKAGYEAGHCNRVFGEAGQAVQNLRKINFLKFCGVIKNFQKSEMKFKVFC